MRLANAQDRWEPNDLNDMHFLGCAAGYADVSVGENKFSDYLQRVARQRGDGARVASSLQQAVPLIEALLPAYRQRGRLTDPNAVCLTTGHIPAVRPQADGIPEDNG